MQSAAVRMLWNYNTNVHCAEQVSAALLHHTQLGERAGAAALFVQREMCLASRKGLAAF